MEALPWFTPVLTLATIAFAALLHASFQLGVSLLTLLSGHSLGARRAHHRLMLLNVAYVGGVLFLVTLLLAAFGFFVSVLTTPSSLLFWWTGVAALNVGIGVAVLLFYYRSGTDGTQLWLPRSFATYLAARTKKTKLAAESFTLGMGSTISELPFIVGPLGVATLMIAHQPVLLQLSGLGLYVLIACVPLLLIMVLVGSGRKISHIQRWREQNKRFLQFLAGSGLIVLGVYIFVSEVLAAMTQRGLPV